MIFCYFARKNVSYIIKIAWFMQVFFVNFFYSTSLPSVTWLTVYRSFYIDVDIDVDVDEDVDVDVDINKNVIMDIKRDEYRCEYS